MAAERALAGFADSSVDAILAVRRLTEIAANQRGTSLVGSELRLFDTSTLAEGPGSHPGLDTTQALVSPFDLGRSYELLLTPADRRRKGAHLTPEAVARQLLAMLPSGDHDDTFLDPAAGGAAFLLAAADQLVAMGADPTTVLDQLHGVDIDPGAVVVAEAALAIWAIDHGVVPRRLPNIRWADGLLDQLPTVDRVVGNPPFLNQLQRSSSHSTERRAALRKRWRELVGAYTDDAWLFLAAGIEALAPGGALALVQPTSVLAARHGQAIRAHALAQASLCGLWVAVDQVFDAAVHVCAVVVDKDCSRSTGPVQRRRGADFASIGEFETQPSPSEWGHVASAALGVPQVHFLPAPSRTVGDLAGATAGFRDQFYGFVPHVSDEEAGGSRDDLAPLITVGMIDVLGSSWGLRDFTFAKRRFRRPVIDLATLERDDPTLYAWVVQRRRPKLLAATQTRVVEVWVDADGGAIPATPVVSVEPHETDVDTLWRLAAALSAPSLSAYFLAAKFGTAMSLNSMKLAAHDLLVAPLPTDEAAWLEAAAMLRDPAHDRAVFARTIDAAYGVRDPDLVSWWLDRLPNHSTPDDQPR